MQAEAVLGVIDAHDDAELRTALDQLAGGVSRRLGGLRNDLLNLLADLEAGLDFVDEHLEFVSRQETHARVAAARCEVERLQEESEGRLYSGDCPRVVLAGSPNAGKSTLFNALLGREQALVSPIAGTTRDYLTAHVHWQGQALELIDTAGVAPVSRSLLSDRDTFSDIDLAAQELRQDQWQRADLAVWCTPCDLTDAERRQDDDECAAAIELANHVLRIGTKGDVGRDERLAIVVSAASGMGLDALRTAIVQALSTERSRSRQWLGATAARCRDTLRSRTCARPRGRTRDRKPRDSYPWASSGDADELLAIELRDALDHLGEIVGAVYTNDLLDRIFSRFCIGK